MSLFPTGYSTRCTQRKHRTDPRLKTTLKCVAIDTASLLSRYPTASVSAAYHYLYDHACLPGSVVQTNQQIPNSHLLKTATLPEYLASNYQQSAAATFAASTRHPATCIVSDLPLFAASPMYTQSPRASLPSRHGLDSVLCRPYKLATTSHPTKPNF